VQAPLQSKVLLPAFSYPSVNLHKIPEFCQLSRPKCRPWGYKKFAVYFFGEFLV
jgi:hypothetical protein